ncbi:MAG: cation:proton antiporter [Oscillospiraceae bacterium]|nr:cation:proton antiporter [Oscillospiraceae bacterium]
MRILLATAFALFAGLMMTRVFKYLHLRFPDVTAFLIAGVLVGPFCLGSLGLPGLGFASMEELDRAAVLSNVALGFIAFDIGNEFRLAHLRSTGRTATVIGVAQALITTLLVDAALVGLYFLVGPETLPLPVAVTLGAIAAATAPAATLMVVRQYKAKGPVTNLLLPIVALDDAVGLVIFAVSIGVAGAIEGGSLNAVGVVVNPLLEIVCSLLLGAFMGALLTALEKIFFSNSNRLSLTIAFVVMTIALSSVRFDLGGGVELSFSSLLVCMMLGTMFCNLSEYSADIMNRSAKWTAPLYAVFFVLSGAQLDLGVFRYPLVILIGVVYILVRCLGKYYGARASSALTGCSETVRRYLGVTLFPQAGVALGMVVSAQVLGAAYGGTIRNIILFSVLIYELVGPLLTKLALERAGEITSGATDAQNRARFEKKEHGGRLAKR